ncbi:MAG: hypothetical protein Q8S02_10265 [Hydrogenophaga sp.]|nr:hypothetical protein [Hydrogenophaga sp.]
MRFRLLRRRLTISAPRMAVRSTLPWPLRWLLGAVVLGFSGALALWAFEFGKEIAGLEQDTRGQLQRLRVEHQRVLSEMTELKSVANTADSLLLAERSAQEQLKQQLLALEDENRRMSADLAFFEQLIPSSGSGAIHVRGLRVQRASDTRLAWQLLVMQSERQPPEFNGQLLISLAGTLDGRPWRLEAPAQTLSLRQHLRLEGQLDLPAQAVLKSATVRLMQGGTERASYTQKL